MAHRHNSQASSRQAPPQIASSASGSGLCITTTNENWRGKNDPQERRRIQNRINQRAFRQRQRAGESPKQYRPRSKSGSPAMSLGQYDEEADEQDDEEEEEDEDEYHMPVRNNSISGSACAAMSPASIPSSSNSPTDSASSSATFPAPVWDELAQLINRNFMQAVVANAKHLGINPIALRNATPTITPRPRPNNLNDIPIALRPIELQHQFPHDPIIDTIPHPRLRFNLLRSVATGKIDGAQLGRCLRTSGALSLCAGEKRRGGLIVWSSPEQLASWELSEVLFMKYSYLLEGCEDFVVASNVWRSRRGERAFPLSW